MGKGRDDSQDLAKSKDLGIPIAAERFRSLVAEYVKQMDSDKEMSPEDYVTMTRLWNTIELHQLGRSDALFRRYSDAFFPAYVERVSKGLNAYPTKGMALYSKEYDIFLGGKPHARSQFKLEIEP